MSKKTMRIYGNFKQFGKWSNPDPGFDGHIIVKENGQFYGYQNELYGSVPGMEDLNNDLNNIRFIAGYTTPSNNKCKKGIAFFKLSRDHHQTPILYVVLDLAEEGVWCVPSFGGYDPQGAAKITLEEVETDDAITKKIENLFEDIRSDDDYNIKFVKMLDSCLGLLENADD